MKTARAPLTFCLLVLMLVVLVCIERATVEPARIIGTEVADAVPVSFTLQRKQSQKERHAVMGYLARIHRGTSNAVPLPCQQLERSFQLYRQIPSATHKTAMQEHLRALCSHYNIKEPLL